MKTPLQHVGRLAIYCLTVALAACTETPGDISRDASPFDGINKAATISVGGTEPFWSLDIAPTAGGYEARYSTPEQPDLVPFAVSRFAGNNGLGFSGQTQRRSINLALTPGKCSDGMSDRTYPYTATLLIGDDTLYGCAHTDLEPFIEGEVVP